MNDPWDSTPSRPEGNETSSFRPSATNRGITKASTGAAKTQQGGDHAQHRLDAAQAHLLKRPDHRVQAQGHKQRYEHQCQDICQGNHCRAHPERGKHYQGHNKPRPDGGFHGSRVLSLAAACR